MSAALTEKQGKLGRDSDVVVARRTSRVEDDSAPFQPRSWRLALELAASLLLHLVVFFEGEGEKEIAPTSCVRKT